MKVWELIEELKKYEYNREVFHISEGGCYNIVEIVTEENIPLEDSPQVLIL